MTSTFSPEMMAKLQSQAQYIVPAAKAVSQFAKFPGPNGKYYAAWNRLTAKWNTKDGCLVVSFAFTSLADVETGKQDFAGYPMIIRFYCRASANQTVQEAWNRLYTDGFQALGINTSAWPQDKVLEEMAKTADWLNEQKLPCIISVGDNIKNPAFKNFNIVEVLNHAATKRFSQPTMHATEDEINEAAELPQIDEDEDQTFDKTLEEGRGYLEGLDRTDLLAQAESSGVEILHPSTISVPDLRSVLLRTLIIGAGKDPADYGLGNDPQLTSSATSPPFDPGATLAEELEEAEETEEETVISIADQCRDKVSAMDRNAAKVARNKYEPKAKFYPSMSDDDIRAMVIEAAVAANDIRF